MTAQELRDRLLSMDAAREQVVSDFIRDNALHAIGTSVVFVPKWEREPIAGIITRRLLNEERMVIQYLAIQRRFDGQLHRGIGAKTRWIDECDVVVKEYERPVQVKMEAKPKDDKQASLCFDGGQCE